MIMRYNLEDGRILVIVSYATIGPLQDSLVEWVKSKVIAGDEEGIFIEGKWYIIDERES